MSEVIALHPARMSPSEYDAERAKLRATYGDSRQEAGARFEQALATLFYRSGWTQDDLAAKEAKSQRWMSYQLCFGRFLNFSTTVLKLESLPINLTERRFRGFWEQTESSPNERIRFQAVIDLMKAETALAAPRRPKIGNAIKEKFADGKWHNLTVIAEKVEADEDHVRETLDAICKNQTYGCKAEKKPVGKGVAYRIFKQDRVISTAELLEGLSPILDGLDAEGRKSTAAYSPVAVAVLANKLRQLLKEWSE